MSDAIRLRYGWQQHRELIASEPRDVLTVAIAFRHPLTHDPQQSIAGDVAGRVIDALEVIEIEIQQAPLSLTLFGRRHGSTYPIGKEVPVLKSRERIKVGLSVQTLGLFQIGEN